MSDEKTTDQLPKERPTYLIGRARAFIEGLKAEGYTDANIEVALLVAMASVALAEKMKNSPSIMEAVGKIKTLIKQFTK